ncbi:hypothetical protein L914_12741, partial [Phytophthora nicotianae]
ACKSETRTFEVNSMVAVTPAENQSGGKSGAGAASNARLPRLGQRFHDTHLVVPR